MSFQLTPRSIKALQGVHPDLVQVIEYAAAHCTTHFVVTEGVRTLERQYQLVAKGASKTLNSRHLTGHAVDLAVMIGGQIRWDWPLYKTLGAEVKSAAAACSIPVIWGGDWKTFKDGPHFELDRKVYP